MIGVVTKNYVDVSGKARDDLALRAVMPMASTTLKSIASSCFVNEKLSRTEHAVVMASCLHL